MVNAVVDSSGFCQFLQPHMIDLSDYYTAFYGEEISKEQISEIAWGCLEDEWAFNTPRPAGSPRTTCCRIAWSRRG